jgi:ABC-type branched-subunit amino acid transport system substrate-binding protein
MNNNWNSQNKKRGWLVLIIVVLSLAITACQAGAAPVEPAVKEGPITIGVSLPQTGRRTESGMAAKNGYEAWVAMVNGAGGCWGGRSS